jgi:uncharacterized protein YegL
MTKKNYTHIGFVMDRSGSMSSMASEASAAFNRFVEEQREVEGEATFTFVDFDNEYNVIHDFVPLEEVGTYNLEPRSMTALLDAIGRTINEIGSRLGLMAEDERPDKVVIAILTDGHENASQEFTRDQIVAMVQEHETKYDWTFIYLGANQDAFTTAQSMGLSIGNAVNFAATGVGAGSGISSVHKAIKSYRSADYDMSAKSDLLSANQADDSEILQ